jgi:fructose-bisphosphate aldolase class II
MSILSRIRRELPGFPLVLHGASAVPHQEVERINAAGGRLKVSASGVPDAEIREAIKLGVCKINIATDMRLIWARTHREFFRDEPGQFDPTVPGRIQMKALADFVYQKCEILGAKGMAKSLAEVCDR